MAMRNSSKKSVAPSKIHVILSNITNLLLGEKNEKDKEIQSLSLPWNKEINTKKKYQRLIRM